jgi:hypothetical protein
VTIQYNPKQKHFFKASLRGFVHHLQRFGMYLVLTGLIQSFAGAVAYEPFGTSGQWLELHRVVSLSQLDKNFCWLF